MKGGWNIWDEMRRMQAEMDNLFSRFFRGEPLVRSEGLLEGPGKSLLESNFRQPLADFIDKGNEIVAKVEMPGVDKKDIEINATEDGIEIKAEHKDEYSEEDKKKGRVRIERNYSGFYRYFSLPKGVDTNKVEATCRNGILELRIPKKKGQKEKIRRIKVK